MIGQTVGHYRILEHLGGEGSAARSAGILSAGPPASGRREQAGA